MSSSQKPASQGTPERAFVSAASFVRNHPEFGLTAKQLTTRAKNGDISYMAVERGQRTFRYYNYDDVNKWFVSRSHRKRRSSASHFHRCSKCSHVERCGRQQRKAAKIEATFNMKVEWPDGDLSRSPFLKCVRP